jgi:hypothetical protein
VALVLAWWLAIVCFQPRADIFIVSSVLLVIVPLAVFVSLGLDTWRAFVGRQHLIEHRLALAVALAIVLVVLGGLGAAALATMFIALGGC